MFGLPGNPVSSLVSFELITRPALRRMMGHRRLARPSLVAVSDEGIQRRPDGKVHLVRVNTAFGDDGRFRVTPVGAQGSHQLAATALADAIAIVPDGDGIPPGGDVAVLDARRLMAVGANDLVDPFGRVIRDLRISVTDRCNFRCTYCMPEEGMTWLPRSEVLTFEEMERLARIFVERYGVEGIRLTGGEPTVRAHLPVLVAQAGRARGRRGDDHQRGDAARHGEAPAHRRSAAGQHQPRFARPGEVRADDTA